MFRINGKTALKYHSVVFLVAMAALFYLVSFLLSLLQVPVLVPVCLRRLAPVLLAAAAGRLFKHLFPNPPGWLRVALCVLSVVAVVLFVYGSISRPILISGRAATWRFYECVFFCVAVFGYLLDVGEVSRYRAVESLVMASFLALMYLGLSSLYSHYALVLPALLAFAYYMLVLSSYRPL